MKHGAVRRMPNVSAYAAQFIDDEEPESAFESFSRERMSSEEGEYRRKERRWMLYAITAFVLAVVTHGWWSFTCWLLFFTWGLGAILAWEQARVARVMSHGVDGTEL